jgi:hypothetical protein
MFKLVFYFLFKNSRAKKEEEEYIFDLIIKGHRIIIKVLFVYVD